MKHLHLYNSQESAVGQEVITPSIVIIKNVDNVLYIPESIGESTHLVKSSEIDNFVECSKECVFTTVEYQSDSYEIGDIVDVNSVMGSLTFFVYGANLNSFEKDKISFNNTSITKQTGELTNLQATIQSDNKIVVSFYNNSSTGIDGAIIYYKGIELFCV